MRNKLVVFFFLLFFTLPKFYAQTAAQIALGNEPEAQTIAKIYADLRAKEALPYDHPAKPSTGVTLVNSYLGLREQQVLLDQLHARLEKQAEDCHFCAPKQDELSELLRQQLTMRHMYNGLFTAMDATPAVQKLLGLTPDPKRWQNRNVAQQDAENFLQSYCDSGVRPNTTAIDCTKKDSSAAFTLAGMLENAWKACFKAHDWVENSSLRVAYETCMVQIPVVKVCSARAIQYCPQTIITAADVDYLRDRNDRWITDPKLITLQVQPLKSSPLHITLIEPIVFPKLDPGNRSTFPNGTGRVVGRLDNPVLGIGKGFSGVGLLVKAGAEVELRFSVNTNRDMTSGFLDINVWFLKNPKGDKPFASSYVRRTLSSIPSPGAVVFPANTSFSFESVGDPSFFMSEAEFIDSIAAAKASAKTSGATEGFSTRPILSNSRLPTVLLEPIDVSGIAAGRSFRGQLNSDMDLPKGSNRKDAVTLPRGTDVTLKVVDKNSAGLPGGHMAELSIDSVMINGQKIAIETPAWSHTFTTRVIQLPHSRPNPADSVLWPQGTVINFTVGNQVEVPQSVFTSGTGLQQLKAESVAQSAADKAAMSLYMGSELSLVMVDPIDLASIRAGKLFHAQLSAPMGMPPVGHRPDILVLQMGTDVYLKAVLRNAGSSARTPVEISTDHFVLNGAEIPLQSSVMTKVVLAQSSQPAQQNAPRRSYSIPGIGVQLPRGLPQNTPSGNMAGGSVLAAQSELKLTTAVTVVVQGARSKVAEGRPTP